VTSRVDTRCPSAPTSQACGSFAPGRVVACKYSCSSRTHCSSPAVCRACRRGEDQNCDSYTFEQGARFGYLGTAYSALRKAGAGPGRTVLIDGISGTLGLGACLIALGLGVSRILGTGRNAVLLEDVKALAPDRIDVHAAGQGNLAEWVRAHNNGEGADIVIDAVGPGAAAESFTDALDTLRRGGIAVDIGGMMERPALDLFAMMCSQISLVGSLWFSTSEAQDMAELAGSGALDLSVLEHHIFPLEKINEALDSIPARHGGFTNFICRPS
jgi:alcohol dehydrogenase